MSAFNINGVIYIATTLQGALTQSLTKNRN